MSHRNAENCQKRSAKRYMTNATVIAPIAGAKLPYSKCKLIMYSQYQSMVTMTLKICFPPAEAAIITRALNRFIHFGGTLKNFLRRSCGTALHTKMQYGLEWLYQTRIQCSFILRKSGLDWRMIAVRLIDADALCDGRVCNDPVVIACKCAKTVDAVPVRCGECKGWEPEKRKAHKCDICRMFGFGSNDFCSYGERKDGGEK